MNYYIYIKKIFIKIILLNNFIIYYNININDFNININKFNIIEKVMHKKPF